MATTGYTRPTTVVSVADSNPPWANASNAIDDDTSYATCDTANNGTVEHLRATGFTWNNGVIPVGSTINGIEFYYGRQAFAASPNVLTTYWRPCLSGANIGTQQSAGGGWETGDITATLVGGAGDLMGTSLTRDNASDSTFGMDLWVLFDDNLDFPLGGLRVDWMWVQLTYTLPPGHPAIRRHGLANKSLWGSGKPGHNVFKTRNGILTPVRKFLYPSAVELARI